MPATASTIPPIAASVLALGAPFRSGAAAAGLPQRVRILAWGENIARPSGKVILVDDAVAETLSANQQLIGLDTVPMDYEHQSRKDHPNYKPDPRHSPGGGVIEVVPEDGVYLSAIEYTPNGLEHAASYKDVSAVVHLDKQGRPLWISSVALTQAGAVAGMEFAEAEAAALSAGASQQSPESKTEPSMNNDANTYRALLVKLLKLKPEATDEELTAAVEASANSAAAPEAEDTACLSVRLEALEKASADRERAALVAKAGAEGKVIPLSAEQIAACDVAILTAMVEQLPAGEVPKKLPGSTQEQTAASVVALSADEKSAAKALGLTEKEYRDANPIA